MLRIGYTRNLLDGLFEGKHEVILSVVEFHEVASNFLEVLHQL